MANEHLQRQAQAASTALSIADNATALNVQDGVRKALTTNSPNPYAMTFEGNVDGKKVVSAYVKKAGRSVVLNEVAKKKGGIAKMYSICIRSAQETKDSLAGLLAVLPAAMQAEFIKSRGGDFRWGTVPDGMALYKFVVLFKSGEKWEGEGNASIRNVRAAQLHNRLDEMAETRAFMRCVGRGTADGFIDPEQAAGSGGFDLAEAELLAEEEGFDHEAINLEADPDGNGFRPSDFGGAGGSQGGTAGDDGFAEIHHPEEAGGRSGEGPSDHAGVQGSERDVRPDSGSGTGEVPSIDELMAIARQAKVMLVTLAQEQYGKKLPQLSGAEKLAIKASLQGEG
jgi:hypothetical protein